MADFRIDRLNPREFEHLTQGLCKKFIAAGVTPFGDGPDGGREASFEGSMDYPSNAKSWSGYLVVQCKFRLRNSAENESDADWAVKELSAELAKYAPVEGSKRAPKTPRRIPKYFLFVTNAVLTPALNSGGRDRCMSLLKNEAQRLGMEGYDVWGFDDLCRFLDLSPELRQTYSGFLLPDDVLHRAIETLNIDEPCFATTLSKFLQKELKSDSAAKLQSAGQHDIKQEIPLSSVFHDIPFDFTKDSALEPNDDHEEVVRFLLGEGDTVIGASSERRNSTRASPSTTKNGRFVLVGGPGQGKSTVGQYLCQLYRAEIIRGVPVDSVDEGARLIVEGIEKSTAEIGISMPRCRRFPFRVVLNLFATDLANDPSLTLTQYIRRRLARLGSVENVSLNTLQKWLSGYPWLFVLDGLDEVPSSSNRTEVLKAIEDFLVDLTSNQTDVLVITTTRPQGYSNDLASAFFHHMYLAPLTEKRALAYGASLLKCRSQGDDDKYEQAVRRMTMATQNPSTARLMRSPLQVTIMATLVERLGEPPKQRYRLFAEYYRTIYDREASREGALSNLLNDRKTDIDIIHYRTGVLLQAASEKAGGTDATVSIDYFLNLVKIRLIDEMGETPSRVQPLITEIRTAALERLVFLVSPQNEHVGFEIRSLQEFMAAEALYKANSPEILVNRITEIAPISHWRNVLLFLVGKCFAEDNNPMLDRILLLCDELNDDVNSPEYTAVRWGSQLALDILVDGVAKNNPKRERKLVQTALRLLECQKEDYIGELASVYHADIASLFEAKIRSVITSSGRQTTIGAWRLLLVFVSRGTPWAVKMFDEHWDTLTASARYKVLDEIRITADEALEKKLLSSVPEWTPWQTFNLFDDSFGFGLKGHQPDLNGPQWLQAARSLARVGRYWFFSDDNNQTIDRPLTWPTSKGDLQFSFRSVSYPKDTMVGLEIEQIPYKRAEWIPYVATARFLKDPNKETLSNALSLLADNECFNQKHLRHIEWLAPWPLAALVRLARTKNDLLEFSCAAKNGDYGDISDWIRNENALEGNSQFLDEALASQNIDAPAAAKLLSNAFLVFGCRVDLRPDMDAQCMDALRELIEKCPTGPLRGWLADQFERFLEMRRHRFIRRGDYKIRATELCDILGSLDADAILSIGIFNGVTFEETSAEAGEKIFEFLTSSVDVRRLSRRDNEIWLDQAYKELLELNGPTKTIIDWGGYLVGAGGLPALPHRMRTSTAAVQPLDSIEQALLGLGAPDLSIDEVEIISRFLIDKVKDGANQWSAKAILDQLALALEKLTGDNRTQATVSVLNMLEAELELDQDLSPTFIVRNLEHLLKTRKASFAESTQRWDELALPQSRPVDH